MPHQESHIYQGEKELRGKGISHDAITDAPMCKRAAVAIVGKSQATAEAAIRLAQFAEKIYWVIPASKLEVPDNIGNELDKIKRIEYFYSSSLKKINGTNEVSSISFLSAGQEKMVSVKYVFLPPQPYKPVTDFLNGSGVQTNQDGVIMVNENFETSVKGIFAVGNILCLKPQLNIVCAAQGAIAALNSENYLR
jgi:thioredoxin reductase (NADPH)